MATLTKYAKMSTTRNKSRQKMFRSWTFKNFMDHYIETEKEGDVRDVTLDKWYNSSKWVDRCAPGLLVADVDQNREVVQLVLDEYGKQHRRMTTLDFKNHFFAVGKYLQSEGIITQFNTNGVKVHSEDDNLSPQERKTIQDAKKSLNRNEYMFVRGKLKGLIEVLLQQEPDAKWPSLILYGMYYIGLNTGARFSEVLGITIEDLDDENNMISINKSWNYKACPSRFDDTKNQSSIRNVAVSRECIQVLKSIYDWKLKYYAEVDDLDKLPILIVPKYRLFNSVVNKNLKQFFKTCEVEPISFHKLRHSYISNLLDQGIDIKIVADQVGHADTHMIMKVYGHILQEKRETDFQKIRMITG